jgi:hypothetical protein
VRRRYYAPAAQAGPPCAPPPPPPPPDLGYSLPALPPPTLLPRALIAQYVGASDAGVRHGRGGYEAESEECEHEFNGGFHDD